MNSVRYVGLDVHRDTISVAVLDESGRLIMQSVLATRASAILDFIHGVRGTVHVTFEEGTHSAWLYDLLVRQVAKLVVCNPRKNALLKSGSKSEAIDARKLAELLRAGLLSPVYHGECSALEVQHLARSYTMLTEDTTRVMNRLKAVFRSQAVAYWGKKLYARRHRDGYLAELSTGGLRRRAECLYQELDALQQLRRVTKRELVVECRKHAAAKWLQSVPFLGPVRAVSIKSRDARLSVRGSVLPVCAKCARALTNFYSAPLRSEGGTRVRVPRPPPELKSATLAHSVYSKLTRLHYIRTASRPVGFYDKAAPEPEQTIFSGRTNLLAS